MAENFTYANIPGYGTNPNAYTAFTSLDQSRSDYWSGGKQKKQLELNKLYQDQFNLLSTEQNQLTQDQFMQANRFKQLEGQGLGLVKQSMGGDNIKSYFSKNKGKKTKWQDPTADAWWKPKAAETFTFPEGSAAAGTTVSMPANTQRWLPTGGNMAADPALKLKMIDGKQYFQNPNWSYGAGLQSLGASAANTGLGKIGAAGAGMPAGVAGIAGGLITKFGGDQDPTTHTATEKLGTGLSYGATAWQLASMVNPVLAVPAAIAAAWWGNSMKTEQANKFKKQQADAKKKWDAKVLEFRRDMRKPNVIGGTKGADINWWSTNLTGVRS